MTILSVAEVAAARATFQATLNRSGTLQRKERVSDNAGGWETTAWVDVAGAEAIACRLSTPSGSDPVVGFQEIGMIIKVLYLLPEETRPAVDDQIVIDGTPYLIITDSDQPSEAVYRKLGVRHDVRATAQ